MKIRLEKKLAIIMSLLDIFGLAIVLLVAFVFQFVLHDLPCPLCLLQRFGLLGISLGVMMNIQFGLRPSHYAISCVSALYLAAVAMRQILLHIDPATGGYGPAIFGFHMYTWTFIIAVAFILFTVFGMFLDRQFSEETFKLSTLFEHVSFVRHFAKLLMAAMLFLALFNAVSTYFECGFAQCPENPTQYLHQLIKAYWENHFDFLIS